MNNYELKTTLVGYEKEIKMIAKIAKSYNVSEAMVLRCLLASSEDTLFNDAMNHYNLNQIENAA